MTFSTVFSARLLVFIASILALSAHSLAQTTSTTSHPASTTATILAAPSPWSYYGCWNETTLAAGTNGARALAGGVEEDLPTMTADVCLAYCKSASYTFAGIEYTRYGSPLVLTFESQMLGNTSIAGFSTDSRQGMLLRQFAQRHF
jgi:hypothetical protein